ncbi:hypothetical protein PSM7751_03705 [Pseudooceanicola marinus]|uniref:SF3 helicase domain-containing protein n=1 Tax=Pseudooceanicola marinus TaxID=396013 RepID=A0A1X7A6P9_9RHOB|nr:phage/plasmid primase, P4 family [Pseudooceanicola marinus]PJE27139.1 hypothetical protein CVM50_17140 [Pseudooceanicola marinus]SLN70252.1 hypothetical protein PSM7751_03705 [Pseudooceanicola marinus]
MDGTQEIRDAFAGAEAFGAGGHYGGADAAPPEDPRPPEEIGSEYSLNDYGNGLRFLLYGGRERSLFVPRVGWHVWTGKVWRLDEDKVKIRALAQRVGGRILEEVPFVALSEEERLALDAFDAVKKERAKILAKDKGERSSADLMRLAEIALLEDEATAARKALASRRRSHTNHAKAAGDTAKINNMLTEASIEVATPLDRLNVDPLAINTATGLVRLVPVVGSDRWQCHVEPHRREHMISKIMPVDFDPDAECPLFKDFVERIQPDQDRRDFLRRWFGYSLTGLTGEQKLVFAHGSGRNGKSTLIDVIAKMMSDYATTVPIETLTGSEQRKGSDATPDLVRIPGARMVRASEPEHGQKMKEALVKALTGGEPILIRRMMQEFVEVTPEFKLTISGNAKPEIRGGDDGIWRRVLLVPFEEQIPDDQVDKGLPAKLWEERAGILQWLIGGALDYLRDGLKIPASVLAATAEYREHSDPLRRFLLDACEITGDPALFTPARDLVEAFQAWQERAGNEPWGKRQISIQIKARSEIMQHPDSGARFTAAKVSDTGYRGIALTVAAAADLRSRRNIGPGWLDKRDLR